MIVRADARWLPLRDNSVNCVVTSPPYWNLRDYGHAGQIGLEPTPDAYVAALVQVFRGVWRVLKDDGTLWVNLGDSYAANRSYQVADTKHVDVGNTKGSAVPFGLKPKDLVGIPWRVAFALQADGWYLRSDIIWSKPNPMPESVTDRPTKAHEYIFLLTKSERYYYDAAAIAEKAEYGEHHAKYQGTYARHKVEAMQIEGALNGPQYQEGLRRPAVNPLTRNKRSVWTVNTQSYSGAHFATMPEALVEPCILAGCPAGGFVLDPFVGSGTVGQVAERLGRRWVGVDLAYQELASKRTSQRGLFVGVGA